jgi:hypothetical protein
MQKQEEKLYKRPEGRKRQKHQRDRQSAGSWCHLYSRHGGEFDLPIHYFQEATLISSTTPIRSRMPFSKIILFLCRQSTQIIVFQIKIRLGLIFMSPKTTAK